MLWPLGDRYAAWPTHIHTRIYQAAAAASRERCQFICSHKFRHPICTHRETESARVVLADPAAWDRCKLLHTLCALGKTGSSRMCTWCLCCRRTRACTAHYYPALLGLVANSNSLVSCAQIFSKSNERGTATHAVLFLRNAPDTKRARFQTNLHTHTR